MKVVDQPSLAFLKELAAATIEAARVRPGQSRHGRENGTGVTLMTPGGRYPALWTRDFAMSLDCGLVGADEVLPQLELIARCQNDDKERSLANGLIIPPFAVPDHVNLADGGAVFFPGTYASGEDQGTGRYGIVPPMDDHFYFIHIAFALWRDTADTAFLAKPIGDLSLLDRLERAFHSPTSDPDTGAAVTDAPRRAVGFGFQDSVDLVGSMAFATLLRYRAAVEMAGLCKAGGKTGVAAAYEKTAEKIATHIVPVLGDPAGWDGWLRAATEVGKQPDVWATLFALHLGVLPSDAADRARKTVAKAVREPGNTVEYQGAVRHVPLDRYSGANQCWDAGGTAVNTYQSGAFWHTPTGWLIEALRPVDPELARQVCGRFIGHLRRLDFRRGGCAPWECFGLEMANAQNPVYMTSVTLPLAALQKMNTETQ